MFVRVSAQREIPYVQPLGQTSDPGLPQQEQEELELLLAALEKKPHLRHLAENPLLGFDEGIDLVSFPSPCSLVSACLTDNWRSQKQD